MTRTARTRTVIGVVAVLAIVCALPAAASASPGQLDPNFGHTGSGGVFATAGGFNVFNRALRQTDGRILSITGGLDPLGSSSVLHVSRYLANGSLDASYGTGGVFTKTIKGTPFDGVLQPDGKLVVVGFDNASGGFFVTRVRTNGTSDPTFVTPHPLLSFGGAKFNQAFAVALGPGGTIVVGGRGDNNTGLARFTTTGALDTTFSGDGSLTHNFGAESEADSVAVLPDGRIIVAGQDAPNGLTRVLVARFTTTGNLDATFGTGGRVSTSSTPIISTNSVLLQGTKAVIAGAVSDAVGGVARFNANGTIDPTFGTAGTTRERVGRFMRFAGITTDGSGRLVAAGDVTYADEFSNAPTFTAAFRYSANGVPDTTFGCRGFALTELLGNGTGHTYDASVATTVAGSGSDVVVGGIAASLADITSPNLDLYLVRYLGGGAHTPGYQLLRGDGGTTPFGGAAGCGSVAGISLKSPVVGMAADPVAPGNWTVASDGGVFTFGAARYFGSTGAIHLNQPIVGMAATPDGKGYWLVARDGGVFAFGSARFFGSTGAIHLNQPIVGMAAARDGHGYWLVARDGGVFAFGSAKFAGSTGMLQLNKPIVGMAADPDGTGYWLVASDGGIFAFASKFSGSTGNIKLNQPIVGIAADPDGTGYWMAARDGGVFAFAAQYNGSTASTPFPIGSVKSTIGIAATP